MKPPSAPRWRPLLKGCTAARAFEAVREISEDLAALSGGPEAATPAGGPQARPHPATLADGSSGLALFFSYLDRARPGAGHGDRASRMIGEAAEAVGSAPLGPWLFGGWTGVAFAIEHVARVRGEDVAPADDPLSEADGELVALLERSPWTDDFDLVSGLVGYGVYALERLPRPAAVRCLELVVERLRETAERVAGGRAWRTRSELMPPTRAAEFPAGHFNLGLAHGTPGVLAFLGRALEARVARAHARPLVRSAVAWLLRQRRGDSGSCFGPWIAPGQPQRDCRVAWCYGDPGVASALLVAARAAAEPDWARAAIEIAARAACRPDGESGVVDAGLCHGAAGLGHVFNRLWQATGREDLRQAAERWFDSVLLTRRPGTGIGGFTAVDRDETGTREVADPGFLTGAAGIGLALLAAATEVPPAWDRILLLPQVGTP